MSTNQIKTRLGAGKVLQIIAALKYTAAALKDEHNHVALLEAMRSNKGLGWNDKTRFTVMAPSGRLLEVSLDMLSGEFSGPLPDTAAPNMGTPPPARNPGPPQAEAPAAPKAPPTARDAAVLVSTATREVKEYKLEPEALSGYLKAGFRAVHGLEEGVEVGVTMADRTVGALVRTAQSTNTVCT